jgi:hypothetical protein
MQRLPSLVDDMKDDLKRINAINEGQDRGQEDDEEE